MRDIDKLKINYQANVVKHIQDYTYCELRGKIIITTNTYGLFFDRSEILLDLSKIRKAELNMEEQFNTVIDNSIKGKLVSEASVTGSRKVAQKIETDDKNIYAYVDMRLLSRFNGAVDYYRVYGYNAVVSVYEKGDNLIGLIMPILVKIK